MLVQPHGCNHGYCGVSGQKKRRGKDELIVVGTGTTLLACVDHVTADGSMRGGFWRSAADGPRHPGTNGPVISPFSSQSHDVRSWGGNQALRPAS